MSLKLSTTEKFRDKNNYGVYCVNICGTGLSVIKAEFKRQIYSGLRQNVYVLDLDDIPDKLNNKHSHNKNTREESKEQLSINLINLVLQHIQEFCKDYVRKINEIDEGLKFDLYQYWLKQNANGNDNKDKKTHIGNGKANAGSKTKDSKPVKEANKNQTNVCSKTLVAKRHNKVGQPTILPKRKFKKDEPILGKLYIIILGQMSEPFYADLLRQDQPLEGIINFIPTESNYDIMLGNNKLRKFIEKTLETINHSNYKVRQMTNTKSIGLFCHKLPVISSCWASQHSQEICNQLTWSIYDIDVLRQQYESYYFQPFQIIDVEMPNDVNLKEFYHTPSCLELSNELLPVSAADLASIAYYLNSLLNVCALENELEEKTQHLLRPLSKFPNSCFIVKDSNQSKTIVLAESNKLLLNMLQYTDLNTFDSIYACCLDYNIFQQYLTAPPPPQEELALIAPSSTYKSLYTSHSIILPKYVKYYADADCCFQRITELISEYEEYQIRNFAPGYKLYTFQTSYHVLKETVGTFILPTRLCFRDFTLFQAHEFLKEFNTPAPDLKTNSINNTSKKKTVDISENIFVKPNSLKTNSQEINKNEEPTSTRSKKAKNPSLKETESIKSEASLGLPPDNDLLKGYNLEDTLQEIKYKTSQYYYRWGLIKLYEEFWCFQDTNKQLSLTVNSNTLHLSRPRYNKTGISKSIRLITTNNISVRILNETKELNKIVMSYPNGLNIFYRKDYCAQVWCCGLQTFLGEEQRIFTNCGAIIVFFKSSDLILIMRYNGEIYKLYQHELLENEEEDDLISLNDIEEKTSKFNDLKAQGDSILFEKLKSVQKTNSISLNSSANVKHKKSLHSQKFPSEESLKSSSATSHNLKYLVENELNFLNSLCCIFHLKYLHVIVTTSQGKQINLTQRKELFEGPECSIHEWHDYYANESYCERGDGVKMIWSQNAFKCFHKDGTVFSTTTHEDVLLQANIEEYESEITQSSSHNKLMEDLESNHIYAYNEQQEQKNFLLTTCFHNSDCTEEYATHDSQIVRYNSESCFMQHPKYATVQVLYTKLTNLPDHIEVYGKDNIKINSRVEHEQKHVSEEYEESEESAWETNLLIDVWIGENLRVTANQKCCELYNKMPQSEIPANIKSDALTLSFEYTDCIKDVFKYMINKISSFENCNKQEMKKLYFMKKINLDESIRGFEFFSSLPLTSAYTQRIGNNITELKPVITMQEVMINNCTATKKDLKKFPRFKQQHQKKTCYHTEHELPRLLLSANFFIEIPKQLTNLTKITKFLEPFEHTNFKSLRAKIKNVLNYNLKPQKQCYLKELSSNINWRERHCEHKRRILNEKQRLSLYSAMNKHKIYPNYWMFTKNFGNELRQVDFYDFLNYQCTIMNRDLKGSYTNY